jgi:hypothetical protein
MAKLSDFYPEFEGWEPVKPVVGSQKPTPPDDQTQVSPYLRAVLPLPLQYSPDTLKQYNRPGLSKFRAAILPPSGVPAVNAAATSAATAAAQQIIDNATIPATGGGLSSVGLEMPQEFSVSNSPLTSNGDIVVGWQPEQLSTFLGVSSVTNVPIVEKSVGGTSSTSSVTTSVTTTGQDIVLYFGCVGTNITGTISSPTGGTWTNFESRVNTNGGWYQNFSSAQVSLSETSSYTPSGGSNFAAANAFATFRTSSAAAVSTIAVGSTGTVSNGSTSTGTVSSGQALVAYMMCNALISGGTAKNQSMNISDNQNNIWYQVGYQRIVTDTAGAGISAVIGVWFCPNPVAASTTFTLNMDSSTGGSGCWKVIALTNLSASSSQLPSFRFINFSDITGINTLAKGGTGSNLSTTGGTSKFLRQNSAGANIDVVQPDWSDLAGAASAVPQNYNGIALVANKIPTEYANINRTNQSSNLALSAIYAVPSTGAGLYRITVFMVVSRAATTSSTLPDSQIQFTDRDSNATITVNLTPGDSGNTTSTFQQATFVVNAKASTNINYGYGLVTGYASTGATSMQFAYRAIVEYLG